MRELAEALVKLLSPYAPHITEELWRVLGHEDFLSNQSWPQVDADALVRESMTIIVQVNGKLRARLQVPVDISKEDLEAVAKSDTNIQKFIQDKSIRKCIVVPKRLVNFVVG